MKLHTIQYYSRKERNLTKLNAVHFFNNTRSLPTDSSTDGRTDGQSIHTCMQPVRNSTIAEH